MRKFRTLLFLAMVTCLSGIALGQSISGEVLDKSSGKPVIGATVTAGQAAAATDESGRFTLVVPEGTKTLEVSSIGFLTLTLQIGNQTSFTIRLEPGSSSLEQVVVVGYGTQKKANLTGAVSTVDTKVLKSRPITDVGRALQGTTPGLTITTASGDLGVNPSIRLRGMSGSLNGGGAQPLILVDNVEIGSLQMVNPEDIESISVLKDAASTSIYGSRAAWGVILITTKSGKRGATPKVTYSNNFSFAKPTTMPKIAGAVEGAEMAFQAYRRINPSLSQFGAVGMYYDEIGIEKMKDWQEQYGGQDLGDEMVMGRDFEIRDNKLFFYRPWDAGAMHLREWTPQQKHDLAVTGGSEKVNYYMGLGYLGQKGVLKVNPDNFNRYNATLGVNASVTDWMDARAKVILSKTNTTTPYSFGGATYDPWYYLYRWQKVYPYGTYQGLPFRSAVTEVEQAKMTDNDANFARLNIGSTLKLAKGLTLDADYTYSNNNTHIHETGGSVTAWNFWAGGGQLNYEKYTGATHDRVRYTSGWNDMHTVKIFGTYLKNFGEHKFKFIAGTDVELYQYWSQYSERRNLMDMDQGELGLATGDNFAGGNRGEWSTNGYFGRINYSYMDKFLLEVNGRVDGSSNFPSNDRFAFFPSVSAGYVISKEDFMDFSQDVLSYLKIRASYGSIGNQDVGRNRFLATMSTTNSNWLAGSLNQVTVTTPGYVSPSLSWETVTTTDVGLDARFFNDKLGVTADWYKRVTSDMITAGVTLPSTLGTTPPVRNYGELTTTGWEVAVDWHHRFANDLGIKVTGVLSNYKEEITRFANTTKGINSFYEGKQLGEIWGYETDRFFSKSDFETDANGDLVTVGGKYVLQKGVPEQSLYEASWFFYGPGDVKYKDLNGDGKITYGANTVDDHGDLKRIGNSTPRYQYGFNLSGDWKGFDLSLFIQGVGKREFWANGPIFVPGYRIGEAWFEHQQDYWTEANPNAYYPRPTDHANSSSIRNFMPQTKYLLNMAYMRLKNLNIGYTFNEQLTKKAKITNLRVYVSGENLFEIDNLDIPIDPEVNYTPTGLNDANTFGRVYPYRRNFSFGVQMTF